MSRYNVVPSEETSRDYDFDVEYYDDDDLELQTRYDEPSIVSITVSRKEKPDGSIVRVKETFLSDGTSYNEETLVPRRKPAETTSPATNHRQHHQRQQSRHQKPKVDTNTTLATSASKTKHHGLEYLPLDHYLLEPMTIQANAKLPQSRNPQTRLLWYILCRCTQIILVLFILAAVILSWLWWNNADDVIEFFHKFLNN